MSTKAVSNVEITWINPCESCKKKICKKCEHNIKGINTDDFIFKIDGKIVDLNIEYNEKTRSYDILE